MSEQKRYTARWRRGEYMDGWLAWDEELRRAGITTYMSGWGSLMHDTVAKALTSGAAPDCPQDGDVIEFTQDDVDRVAGMIEEQRKRRESQRAQVKMVRCTCGHTVPATLVMNASRGTCCPDCYDRMSD